jgi:hypothetical protein
LDRQLVLPRDRRRVPRPHPARRRNGRPHANIDLTVPVGVEFTDDVEAAGRRHADGYAFTFGAMGSAATTFYNNAFERQGYGDDVRAVQSLWLAGDKDAARRRVPTAIGLGTNLIGTDDLVRDRLRRYRDAGITTLRANLHSDPAGDDLDRPLDNLGRLLDHVRAGNDEPNVSPTSLTSASRRCGQCCCSRQGAKASRSPIRAVWSPDTGFWSSTRHSPTLPTRAHRPLPVVDGGRAPPVVR